MGAWDAVTRLKSAIFDGCEGAVPRLPSLTASGVSRESFGVFCLVLFFLIHLFLKALSGDAMHRRSEETAEPEVSEEKLADWAMSLHVTLLMVTFLGGYWLSNIEFKYLGESGFGLIVGASFCVPILHGGGLLGVSRRE